MRTRHLPGEKATKQAIKYTAFLFLSVFILYCGDPIPVEEMGNARYDINRAETVKAEKYAPEQLKAAKDALFEAHEMISNKKIKEAKGKAEKSSELANEAFNISAPQLAKDTKAEALEILAAAEKAYAEEFAKTEYESAKNYLAAGDDKMKAETYYEAFLDYEQSREEAIKARNKAEAQSEVLARDVEATRESLKEAIQYGAKDSSPDKILAAEKELTSAEGSIKTMSLKGAYLSLQRAKDNINQAMNLAKKNWAAKKRTEATAAVEKAESNMVRFKDRLEGSRLKKAFNSSEEAQNSLKSAEEALAAAQESLSAAGESIEAAKYNDSVQQSEEAIRLSGIVNDQIPQLLVMLNDLAAGRKPIAITTKTDTTPEGTSDTDTVAEGWKKYKVRLIPANRDCLWKIAGYNSIYGNAYLWPRIYKANKGRIRNPDLIYPGQVFDVPPKKGNVSELLRSKKSSKTVIHKPKMEEEDAVEVEEEAEEVESEAISPADNI